MKEGNDGLSEDSSVPTSPRLRREGLQNYILEYILVFVTASRLILGPCVFLCDSRGTCTKVQGDIVPCERGT